jgi:Tol biopolymer transport system component
VTRGLVLPVALLVAGCAGPRLPPDLTGQIVFVSDRDGRDALYLRRLPKGDDRLLMTFDSPLEEPALSPDGRTVAFGAEGRIGVVSVVLARPRFVTFAVDFMDTAPAWRPDGKALVVVTRKSAAERTDLHLLTLEPPPGTARREPITSTPTLDETEPDWSPDGRSLLFVRGDNLFRLDVAGGGIRRLTGGFRTVRSGRYLPDGRVLCLWYQGKQCGLDVMDASGGSRQTLAQGDTFYRDVAPSPDGRYLAASLAFAARALALRQRPEVRLLDARGQDLGILAGSSRSNSHSAHWGR